MDNFSFEPEIALDERDRSNLASVVVMPGYRVLHRLLRAEVDRFILALINTDAKDDAGVIAAHRLAKAAAQFYEGVTSRVNEIVRNHLESSRQDEKPIDITENLLDLERRCSWC